MSRRRLVRGCLRFWTSGYNCCPPVRLDAYLHQQLYVLYSVRAYEVD